MHQSKKILQGKKAIDTLMRGVNLVADIVKQTLGPKGRNVVFADMYGMPTITNDGVSIARQVFSEDETEQLGIDIVKQSSFRTNLIAGDGTTSSIVLAQAIIKEGLQSKTHPLVLRNEINSQCAEIVQKLIDSARPISTHEEIARVATISSEDPAIGEIIATATETIGKEGQITVQESEINGLRVEYTSGLEIDEGYIADFMMNNERGEAIINNPYILIVDSKLSNIKDLLPILQKVADAGMNEVVLVCDGLDGNMLPTIAMNKRAKYIEGKPVMEIFAVKFPAIRKDEFVEDIALVTQGKVIGLSTGLFPDKATLQDLGRCERVVMTNKKTSFINGQGDVSEKVATLKNQRDASEINKEDYNNRIARLQGKVAVIRVGAPTEAELRYMKLKIDDAVCATKAAMEEGVVRGGGIALKTLALDMEDGVLKNALQSPYNQIQENAGGHFTIADDIVDPVKVVRYALLNAVSCAGALLTISSSIATTRVIPEK